LAREATDLAAAIEAPEALWQARLAAGRALTALGERKAASEELDGAIDTIESLRLHVAGPGSALPGYFSDKVEPYRERMTLALSAGDVGEALSLAERSKARALTEILESGRLDIVKAMSEDERRKERELQNQLVALNQRARRESSGSPGTLGSSPLVPGDVRPALERKRREWESFRTSLYASHPELAVERGESVPMTTAEMQSLSRATGAAILDYVVTPRASHLFVLVPSGPVRMFPIPIDSASLEKRAAEVRREMASRELGFAEASRAMYRLLLAPAASVLSRHRSWIVVPDGPLWDVPFHALQDGAGHYVIESSAVSYTPSLGVLQQTLRRSRGRSAPDRGRDLLALGNPAVSGAEALPAAERQVVEIAKLYGEKRSRIATGSAASEHLFRSEAGRYRVLHLAAHAVLDDANPMYSHVLLAPGAGEDGLLEARKLMDLDLHADMLVLSACETARGAAPAGEGISGMLWAAFAAGAPTTVASLWRVESASTSELMIEFHRQWLAGRGKGLPFARAEALRSAARRLIASGKYAHPFYWAGFILAGSP
jgi:CHAT domain-containing protein